jgi:hypothetical protein
LVEDRFNFIKEKLKIIKNPNQNWMLYFMFAIENILRIIFCLIYIWMFEYVFMLFPCSFWLFDLFLKVEKIRIGSP